MLNEDKLYTSIGARIRRLREAQDPRMSQADLARLLDLKRTSVTNIERGNQKLTLETIYRICERFGLQVQEILPPVSDVTHAQDRSVTVGGKSHEVGAMTAKLVESLRPNARVRR